MTKQNIDKVEQTIKDALDIIPDIQDAKESDGKITWSEGLILVVTHATAGVRFVSNLKEIGEELVDLDEDEAAELYDIVAAKFGGTDDVKAAVKNLVKGAADISQGLQVLLAKKAGE